MDALNSPAIGDSLQSSQYFVLWRGDDPLPTVFSKWYSVYSILWSSQIQGHIRLRICQLIISHSINQ